jgi:hypothetical protein
VERGGGDDDVERLGWQRPVFEGGGHHVDGREPGEVAPGYLGQILEQLRRVAGPGLVV